MMRRIALVIAAWLALAGPAYGQPGALPDVGELISRSKRDMKFITTDGCLLAFSVKDKHLFCANPRLVSVYRSADSFGYADANPATLSCGTLTPCVAVFPDSADARVTLDWIMPTTALDAQSAQISWTSAASTGTVQWMLSWCVYGAGEVPCQPDGSLTTSVGSSSSGADKRNDAEINPFSPEWGVDKHVVVVLSRDYAHAQDTLVGDARVEGVRLEFLAAQ